MDCLTFQSLIGILVIESLKAEERAVVRSQGIFSIPDRDSMNLSALDLYYNYSTQVLHRVKKFPWLIQCELYVLFIILTNQENAKSKCRPPPDQPYTQC